MYWHTLGVAADAQLLMDEVSYLLIMLAGQAALSSSMTVDDILKKMY